MTTPADTALVDPLVAPLLLALRDCVREQLAHTLAGPVCRAFISWGAGPPIMDGCHCGCTVTDAQGVQRKGNGDGWVRMAALTPDTTVSSGARRTAYAGGCPPAYLVTIGMGHYRCVPVGDPETGPLDEQTETAKSLMLLSDTAALRRVIRCCPILKGDESGIGDPMVTTYNPIRAADCAGGEMLIRVPVYKGEACP